MNYILRRLNVDVDVVTDAGANVDVNCNTINFERQDRVDVENVQNHFNGMYSIFKRAHVVRLFLRTR